MAALSSYLTTLIHGNQSFSLKNDAGLVILSELKIKNVEHHNSSTSATRTLATTTNRLSKIGKDIQAAKVLTPTSIRVEGMVTKIDNLMNLFKFYSNLENLYTLTSRGILVKNLSPVSLNFRFSAKTIDVLPFELFMEQVVPPSSVKTPAAQADKNSIGIEVLPNNTALMLENKISTWIKTLF